MSKQTAHTSADRDGTQDRGAEIACVGFHRSPAFCCTAVLNTRKIKAAYAVDASVFTVHAHLQGKDPGQLLYVTCVAKRVACCLYCQS